MRKFRINAASVAPAQFDSTVDDEFMQDMSSIITLEDGTSLDLKKTVLLYNPNTHKIQLTDSDSVPKDFIQVATLTLTPDEPTPVDVPEGPPVDVEPESDADSEPESDEVPEEPEHSEESGDFFQ